MKDLPKVFANKIEKEFNNTQSIFYSSKKDDRVLYDIDINSKINSIFSSKNHVYKSKCQIKYNDHEEEKVIIGKKDNYLITIDGSLIDIKNILDIKKIY